MAIWRESHGGALRKHIPGVEDDRGTMRAQMAVIRDTLKRWETGKVTARWIEEAAMRHDWHLKLKRYATEHLVPEVGISDRKVLFKNINNNVFGREESDKNEEKFSQAISLLNEKALGVRLYWDDALQRIPVLKDGSVALVIADPPYNVTDAPWDRFPSPEKYLEWLETWLEVLRPKLARDYHLFLFCDPSYMARIEEMLVQHGWPIKSRIIWAYRNLSMGRDVTDRFISSWQPVFHCGSHALNWSPDWSEERFDVQLHAAPQSNFKDKKQHPMAKPLKLIELFVRAGSKPGDIVLDPFAGGGVTGEACSRVKQRRCILIEKEEEFIETIERRLGIKRVKEENG
jgi:16S rRNA G966 N2-methylase RsmD